MTTTTHHPRCTEQSQKAEAWRAQWPYYCRECNGYGLHVLPGGRVTPDDIDPCSNCAANGYCPRCGRQGLSREDRGADSTGEGPCTFCQWNYNDGLPPEECYCYWIFEMENLGGRLAAAFSLDLVIQSLNRKRVEYGEEARREQGEEPSEDDYRAIIEIDKKLTAREREIVTAMEKPLSERRILKSELLYSGDGMLLMVVALESFAGWKAYIGVAPAGHPNPDLYVIEKDGMLTESQARGFFPLIAEPYSKY